MFFVHYLFLPACSDKNENKPVDEKNKYVVDSSDLKTKPVENQNEQFSLIYNFEKGKTYHYRLLQSSVDNQEMKTDSVQKQSVKQSIIYLLDITPAQKDPDGTLELNITVKSIKLDAQANGQNYSFESSSNKDSAARVQYAEYDCLTNNPFSARISKKGEILEIFRADKISNKYIELKGYSDSVNAEQKNMIRNNMIQGALRPLVVQLFRPVPETPVAKDSNWTFMQPPTQFMTFSLQNTNTFKINSLTQLNDDKVAVIDAGMNTGVTGETKGYQPGCFICFYKTCYTC